MPATTKSRSSRVKRTKPGRREGTGANYFAGRRAEYRSIQLLENAGYLCVRAAGSKGPADVVAISSGPPLLVQVKRGKATIGAIEREKLKDIRRTFHCRVIVHHWKKHARQPLTEEIG